MGLSRPKKRPTAVGVIPPLTCTYQPRTTMYRRLDPAPQRGNIGDYLFSPECAVLCTFIAGRIGEASCLRIPRANCKERQRAPEWGPAEVRQEDDK